MCDWDLVGCDADGFVKQLTLDFNNLTGSLPPLLGSLASLQDLDLEQNALSGTLPASLANLVALTQLGLGGNQFVGALPQELCSLLGRVNSSTGPRKPCDLSGNRFDCPLPCAELSVDVCHASCR